MAAVILKNRPNGHVTFKAIANSTIQLSDAVVDANNENVGALNITRVKWVGDWTIKRGANVVWQANSATFGDWDFQAMGCSLNEFNSANIVLTTAGTTSTIIIECNKATVANGEFGGLY